MSFKSKMRECRFCHAMFSPMTPHTKYCSESCKKSAERFRANQRKRDAEERLHIDQFHERERRGLSLQFCRQCGAIFYTARPHSFCSPACETIFNGGHPVETGRKVVITFNDD